MASKRRLSAPNPTAAASSSLPAAGHLPSSSDTTLIGSSPPTSASASTPIHAKSQFNASIDGTLFQRAEKLARMTTELKLHKVVRQAADLTRDLEKLSHRTQHNETFRQQHQERMEKMWHEVLAIRAQAEVSSRAGQQDRLEMKEYRREVVEVRSDMDRVQSLVGELVEKVGRLPTLAEANAVLAAVATQREASELAAAAAAAAAASASTASKDIQHRIRETIKSTRRWHHEHKTTTLSDAAFTARYLRKQSKRDPRMAVHLQKAIHRRVKTRRRQESGSPPHPQPTSLDEFCEHVCWADVTQTVEDMLLNKVDSTVRSLSQTSP